MIKLATHNHRSSLPQQLHDTPCTYKNRSDSIPFVKGLVMSLSSVTAAEYIFLDNKHYDVLYNNGIMFAKKSGLYYVATLSTPLMIPFEAWTGYKCKRTCDLFWLLFMFLHSHNTVFALQTCKMKKKFHGSPQFHGRFPNII